MPEDSKWCPECDEVKLRIEFARNRSQAAGIGTYCRPCDKQITRRDKEKHGGACNYHLRRRYGISAEHAGRMFAGSVGRGETGIYVIRREPDDAPADGRRPDGEDSTYLFDYLDSIGTAA